MVEVPETVRVLRRLLRPFGSRAPVLVAVVVEAEVVADLVGERREPAVPPRSAEPCTRMSERFFLDSPRPAGRSDERDTARLVALANVVGDQMREVGALFLPGEQDPIQHAVRVGPGTVGVSSSALAARCPRVRPRSSLR